MYKSVDWCCLLIAILYLSCSLIIYMEIYCKCIHRMWCCGYVVELKPTWGSIFSRYIRFGYVALQSQSPHNHPHPKFPTNLLGFQLSIPASIRGLSALADAARSSKSWMFAPKWAQGEITRSFVQEMLGISIRSHLKQEQHSWVSWLHVVQSWAHRMTTGGSVLKHLVVSPPLAEPDQTCQRDPRGDQWVETLPWTPRNPQNRNTYNR